ncbi:hypothetical protein CRUP_005201 [Coryphaenoides rupestris]|nr:hypothetical protein CRUP_005201 [Coryphaenoides rupestris]
MGQTSFMHHWDRPATRGAGVAASGGYRPGGRDCFSFSAFSLSVMTRVYRKFWPNLEPMIRHVADQQHDKNNGDPIEEWREGGRGGGVASILKPRQRYRGPADGHRGGGPVCRCAVLAGWLCDWLEWTATTATTTTTTTTTTPLPLEEQRSLWEK